MTPLSRRKWSILVPWWSELFHSLLTAMFTRKSARHSQRFLLTIENLLTYLLTYLLTPWCRVLLEQLNVLQLDKKFPAFHGTRRFITELTTVRHLSLSWASPIQSIYPQPTSWRSILILSTHLRLRLPSGLLPSGFPTKTLYTPSPHQYAPQAQTLSFFSILIPLQYWVRSTNHLAWWLHYLIICDFTFVPDYSRVQFVPWLRDVQYNSHSALVKGNYRPTLSRC